MIDTEDIKKFRELAIECKVLEKDLNLYGVIGRLRKQYGTEILVDALNFFTEKMIQNKMRGFVIPALVGFCSKASKYTAMGEATYGATKIDWAQDLDIGGLDDAIKAFSERSGKASQIAANWSDKEIKQEILFLRTIRLEWGAVKKINKIRLESRKRYVWHCYKKSIRNIPLMLLQSQHEMRIAEYRNNKNNECT